MRLFYRVCKLSLFTLVTTLLTSCALFSSPAPNPTLFTLDAGIPHVNSKSSVYGATLLVFPVTASPQINNNRMAYVLQNHQIAYFAKNRWAAPPAQMLQPLIRQYLTQSHHFGAVVATPFVDSVDLRLYTQLLTLQQNFTTQPSQIEMVLAAQLVDSNSGKTLGSQQFSAVIPAAADNPEGGAFAANQATAQILNRLTAFCVQASARAGK